MSEQRPLARHGQQRSPRAWGQLMKMLGIALAVVLVSTVGVVTAVAYDLAEPYISSGVELERDSDAPPDLGSIEGGFNLLLVGVDTCEPEYAHLFADRCTGEDASGTLNDVNILVNVSDSPRRVTAVSFPRDLMIPIPSCTDENGRTYSAMTKQRLNSAFHYGGLNCVAKTIYELTGQYIDFAATITFGGVIEITTAIGGVEVCVENGINDPEANGLHLTPGTHTIDGIQALGFLRTRKGVGDGSDLGRIGNQQQYMSNLVRKLVSEETLTNPKTLFNLARVGLNNVTPSTELQDPILVAQLALVLKDVPFEDIVFLQYPTLADPDDPDVTVVPNSSDATLMWDAINANKSLTVTHVPGRYDGVTIIDDETDPDAVPEPGADDDLAEPDDTTVALPESIRGNNVATRTCSNGRG